MSRCLPLLLAALTFILTGCATTPQLTLDPVGPLSGHPLPDRLSSTKGFLEVYNQRRQINDAGIFYEGYTPYLITDPDGHQVQSVANRVGSMDQRPMRVPLPEGRYYVVASSEGFGRVRVPVVVRARQLTQVFLTHDGFISPPNLADSEWVRLPNGPIVGRRTEW